MAMMMGGGAMALLSGAAMTFYFQPHRVIAVLVKQFPRIVWCLSAHVETVANASENSSRQPSRPSTPHPQANEHNQPQSTPHVAQQSRSSSSKASMAWTELKGIVRVGSKLVQKSVEDLKAHVVVSQSSHSRVQSQEFISSTELTEIQTIGDAELADLEEGRLQCLHETKRVPGVTDNVVALTIDDSPSEHTAEILDILKENNAKATFFIIGQYVHRLADGHELLSRMVAEGHELGNHTMHDRPTVKLSRDEFLTELVQVDSMLEYHQPARDIKWFRPGSGVFTQEMCDVAESLGYRTILGCRFPVDTTSRDPRLNAWHVSSGIHPGAIVVLHDYRAWILDTLRILLPELTRKGYRVVNSSELYRLASADSHVPSEVVVEGPSDHSAAQL
ncbi:hypothetical protein HDU78_002403 [Chytriomyces hyalinus]|nr:hypothetical protein HDU78_002403 [Chytriomyces hyalinus]